MAKDFVVKLAQQGFDALTAGDENLVYNSNWPLLKIYRQGSYRPKNDTHQVVIDHDLGYPPAFMWFANIPITDWTSPTSGAVTRRSEFNGPLQGSVTSTERALMFDLGIALTGVQQFYYYIFALDLTKPYTAPSIRSGGVIGPRNLSTVFKLAKPNKDISSNHLEDYVVHSDARSPMVHMVYPGVTDSANGFTFYHNLGYAPMALIFENANLKDGIPIVGTGLTPNSWEAIPASGASGFTIDDKKISYLGFRQGEQVSIVVLKDPFNIDYSVRVSV